MELNKVEISRVTEVANNPEAVVELQELQLALVGGGIGETVL
jgi:hypothetical protein